MSLLKALTEKPWLDSGQNTAGEASTPPQRIALRFFLGVVGVLFGLFIVAYYIRMELNDWRPMPEPFLLWINTFVLFMSSAALQWTLHCVSRQKPTAVKAGMLIGGLLTLAFIFGQISVWKQMSAGGYYLYNNPANAFFYILTGIHGLHLLGGLWVWTWTAIKVWSGSTLTDLRLSIELCTVYWHFLLIVWLVLFALLSYT